MYETKTKLVLDWNNEVNVNITLKELAVMYSLLAKTSTREADTAVNKVISANLNVCEGDVPYRMYGATKKILTDNGVKVLG